MDRKGEIVRGDAVWQGTCMLFILFKGYDESSTFNHVAHMSRSTGDLLSIGIDLRSTPSIYLMPLFANLVQLT